MYKYGFPNYSRRNRQGKKKRYHQIISFYNSVFNEPCLKNGKFSFHINIRSRNVYKLVHNFYIHSIQKSIYYLCTLIRSLFSSNFQRKANKNISYLSLNKGKPGVRCLDELFSNCQVCKYGKKHDATNKKLC